MKVSVCREIASLKDSWLELQSNGVCHVFQTYGWVTDWMETVGKAQRAAPFIVAVSLNESESPSAIIPLCVRRIWGVRILTMIGGFHADYAGGVLGRECFIDDLWEKIVPLAKDENVDIIWVRNIPERIGDIRNPLFSKYCLQTDKAHAVSIEGSWHDFYESGVKPRIRADSRRQIKRLSEIGELSFQIAENESEINRLTEMMISQKRARYEAMGVKDQFLEPANRGFYLKRNEGMIGPRPHVSALRLDDGVIAVHWGEIYRGTFYYLMPSHDPEWEKYSPGRMLLENLLQWCFSEGLKIFDFTGGGEAYKLEWANSEIMLYEYERALTIKGKAFRIAKSVYRSHVSGMIRAYREGKWKR